MEAQVEHPQSWNMGLRIGPEQIEAVAGSLAVPGSLIYKAFRPGLALEDAVFDTPLLTLDFGRVTIVVETKELLPVPEGLNEDQERTLFENCYPESHLKVITENLPQHNAAIVFGINKEIWGFLHRTYPNGVIRSHLGQLCRYFQLYGGGGNGVRTYAVLRKGKVDVIALDGHKLLVANTMECQGLADVVYYILATRQTLGMPVESSIYITGEAAERAAVAMQLRAFAPKVLPAVFPADLYSLGKETQTIPLDLASTMLNLE